MSIPKRLVRTVPEHTSDEIEQRWEDACRIHPGWPCLTFRDPVNRDLFPLTSPYWDSCQTGAQLADLIRAEDLYQRGGWYIDSDYEVWRSFAPLCPLKGCAAWEDEDHIPNAVMGFEPGHQALVEVIDQAIARQHLGTWQSGVWVTTEVFRGRRDMVVLPPGVFYPVHYRQKSLLDSMTSAEIRKQNPWSFGMHRWAHSWA